MNQLLNIFAILLFPKWVEWVPSSLKTTDWYSFGTSSYWNVWPFCVTAGVAVLLLEKILSLIFSSFPFSLKTQALLLIMLCDSIVKLCVLVWFVSEHLRELHQYVYVILFDCNHRAETLHKWGSWPVLSSLEILTTVPSSRTLCLYAILPKVCFYPKDTVDSSKIIPLINFLELC